VILGFPALQRVGLRSGLLAFYKLSDTSDSSGRGNTLTNNGGVTFVAGKIGNAAEFDGENYFETESIDLTGLTALTICFWVQHEDQEEEEDIINEVAGDWFAGTGPMVIAFGGLGQHFAFEASTLGVAINGDFGFKVLDTTIRSSDWRFVAIKYTGTSLQLRTNNEDWITTVVSGSPPLDETNGYFRIGDSGDSLPLANGDKLDAFGIWSRALSDAEIDALYNNGTGRELP
jgi:hypothetical protein